MGGAYGGFIIITLYGGGSTSPEEFFLITNTNLDILTQNNLQIFVQF